MKGTKAVVQTAMLTSVAVWQIVLTFLFYSRDRSPTIQNIGWFILWISAVFGWLVGSWEPRPSSFILMESVPRANFVPGIFRRLGHTA
jgi:hypothetical protein